MRCKVCGQKAEIELPRHNSGFCREHFIEYFHNQVKRAINKEKMILSGQRVLVVVSGGKDSLVLWEVLHRLGYKADGLYINLGIGEYSFRSREKCLNFAQTRNVKLYIVSLPETLGMGIQEISRKMRRTPCSICGLVKRYIFNRFAYEKGYDIVATGHNLDDEAATLLGNLIHWQEGYLSRQAPVMPSTHPQMAKKIKPLFRVTEKETTAYAIMQNIDYIYEECLLAKGARSIVYKNALNYLESVSPGTKQQLYFGFLQKGKKYFKTGEDVELKACARCRQPTTAETCAFCRMLERIGVEDFSLDKGTTVAVLQERPWVSSKSNWECF